MRATNTQVCGHRLPHPRPPWRRRLAAWWGAARESQGILEYGLGSCFTAAPQSASEAETTLVQVRCTWSWVCLHTLVGLAHMQ